MTGLMLTGTVRAAVLLAAVLLVLPLLRRRMSASLQHLVLMAVLAVQVLIPALAVLAPRWSHEIIPARVSASIANIESKGAIIPQASASVARTLPALQRSPIPIIPAVWLLVTISIAAWMSYGRMYMNRIAQTLRRERRDALADILEENRIDTRIRRPITLLVGGPFFVPVTWGVIYPVILLPEDARTWDESRKRLVMLHELAHVKRQDHFTYALAGIVCAVCWFNPLVWIALRKVKSTAERAADDLVIRSGVRPSSYVDTLVDMLKRLGPEPLQVRASFAMARKSEIENRMLAVLDKGLVRSPGKPGMIACAALLLIATTTLGLSSVPGVTALEAQTSGLPTRVSAWLKAAEQAPGDPGRFDPLSSALAEGPLTREELDHYLGIVGKMSNPVAKSEALRILAESVTLDDDLVTRSLEISAAISSSVPRAVALRAIATSQTLTPAARKVYLGAASTLDGPALASVLKALE